MICFVSLVCSVYSVCSVYLVRSVSTRSGRPQLCFGREGYPQARILENQSASAEPLRETLPPTPDHFTTAFPCPGQGMPSTPRSTLWRRWLLTVAVPTSPTTIPAARLAMSAASAGGAPTHRPKVKALTTVSPAPVTS